jgi:hypothetical protein
MLKGKSQILLVQTDCCTFILHSVTFYTAIIFIVITTTTSNPNTSYQLLCRWIFKFFHVTVHRNKFLFNKTNRRTNFPNLFLLRNSTYFGQFLCPSSGVFHCTFGTGMCHAGLMPAFKHDQDGTAVSSWSYSLKRGCEAIRLLGMRVRTPLSAWISDSCEYCVLSERSLRRTDRSSIGVLPSLLCVIECDREASTMRTPWPTTGCRATRKKRNYMLF